MRVLKNKLAVTSFERVPENSQDFAGVLEIRFKPNEIKQRRKNETTEKDGLVDSISEEQGQQKSFLEKLL